MSAGFRVDKTSKTLSADALALWSTHRITGVLEEIPGVGPQIAKTLRKAGVSTTHQLLGKFLEMKGEGMGSQDNCDAFYGWLASAGVDSHRADITLCMAEKCGLGFPGLFERTELEGMSGGGGGGEAGGEGAEPVPEPAVPAPTAENGGCTIA